MPSMDVTLAILVHNALPFLQTTIQSIRKNTNNPYRLLVIDDASDTTTKNYLHHLHDIDLITNQKQMGFPHNANLAIDHSETSFLVLLNSDIYVTEGWLSLLINCLKDKPDHGIAGPSTSFAWGEQRIIDRPDWSIQEIEEFGRKTYQLYGCQIRYLDRLHSVCGFCYAFKREVVQAIGYFDEAYGLGQCEEIDYNTRAAWAGYKCVWVCGAYVHHFGSKSFQRSATRELLLKNKRIYQDKFCSLQINKKRASYCEHCLATDSPYFTKPADLTTILRQTPSYTIESLL